MGEQCRYDAADNRNDALLAKLEDSNLVPFCPEDHAFGSPRPTMDLIQTEEGINAISNKTGANLSFAVEEYAKHFFDTHPDIDIFIGKDRSPSCAVCSAKLYDENRELISVNETGLMAKEAKVRGIEAIDAEQYLT